MFFMLHLLSNFILFRFSVSVIICTKQCFSCSFLSTLVSCTLLSVFLVYISFGARETSSRSPNQKSRIIELKQPDLNTFSSFGSLNLSKRNQSHQTRRSDLTWFELARFEYFSIFGSQSLSKRNQSRQTRRSDLTWFESARFEYFLNPDLNTFSIFGSQNLSKRNQSHQTRRSDMTWFESARFEYFFNLWQPKPVQKESTYMKRMHVIMRCVAGSVRCGFGPGPGPGLREARRSRLEAIWVCGEEA